VRDCLVFTVAGLVAVAGGLMQAEQREIQPPTVLGGQMLDPEASVAELLAYFQEAAPPQNQQQPERPRPPAVPDRPGTPGCLSEPRHFTATPNLAEGVELAFSRYLRFTTEAGEVIHARMFLLEIRPDRARFPDAPPEVQEQRRAVPARMTAIAHEIAVDDPDAFEPDYDLGPRYVTAKGACAYEVNLGSVTCLVRIAER
jgi:hypothetical protein